MIDPLSCCKDYTSDRCFSEQTDLPYRAYGLTTKKEGIFVDGRAYLIMGVLKQGARNPVEYPEYNKDVKQLTANFGNMQTFMNWFEDRFGVPRTVITMIEDNRYCVNMPDFWVSNGTYRISLYGLLLRSALWYKDGNPMDYIAKVNDEHQYMLNQIRPKLERMVGGFIPSQDPKSIGDVHNNGICVYQFPVS